VAWRGETPVVVWSRRLLLLMDRPQVLLTAPAGTEGLEIAVDAIDAAPREPGRPNPGSLVQRFRPAFSDFPKRVWPILAVTIMFAVMSRRRWRSYRKPVDARLVTSNGEARQLPARSGKARLCGYERWC